MNLTLPLSIPSNRPEFCLLLVPLVPFSFFNKTLLHGPDKHLSKHISLSLFLRPRGSPAASRIFTVLPVMVVDRDRRQR